MAAINAGHAQKHNYIINYAINYIIIYVINYGIIIAPLSTLLMRNTWSPPV